MRHLYYEHDITINLHLLTHIEEDISRFGPFSTHSMFRLKQSPYYDFVHRLMRPFEKLVLISSLANEGLVIDSHLLPQRTKNTAFVFIDGSKGFVMLIFEYNSNFYAVVDKWYHLTKSFTCYYIS